MISDQFSGRATELKKLEDNFQQKRSSIVAIYGRRRIGKSTLVQQFGMSKNALYFEALEKEPTSVQIQHFTLSLARQVNDPILNKAALDSWSELFDYLTAYLQKQDEKVIIFFDEFQWMAAGQTKLVSLVKYYWDNHWKKYSVQLILCGSISSFMVGKVIKSKALYGRIDVEIRLIELQPKDVLPFFKNKISQNEILLYLLIFGGVPKYLELIDLKMSFDQNIQKLCFDKDAYFQNEFDKIFYSQFKQHRLHEKIIRHLSRRPMTLGELSVALKTPSGGGLKRYLDELQLARFIVEGPAIEGAPKKKKYYIFDEYLIFYFKFIEASKKSLIANKSKNYFKLHVKAKWQSWLGFSFERFCLKSVDIIAETLGITDSIITAAPYCDTSKSGAQIDLLIQTSDKTTYVCECKYYENPIEINIIGEFDKKLSQLKLNKKNSIKKVLVTNSAASKSLLSADYFDNILTSKDFFNDKS